MSCGHRGIHDVIIDYTKAYQMTGACTVEPLAGFRSTQHAVSIIVHGPPPAQRTPLLEILTLLTVLPGTWF